MSAQQIQMGEI